MNELEMKELLELAAEEMIAYSKNTAAPIDDVVYSSVIDADKPLEIVVLFAEVEHLKNMEDQKLKDPFMSVFIKYLTAQNYPFGDRPQMKFQFSVSI